VISNARRRKRLVFISFLCVGRILKGLELELEVYNNQFIRGQPTEARYYILSLLGIKGIAYLDLGKPLEL